MNHELDELFHRIRERYSGTPNSCHRESLLAHLRSLATIDEKSPEEATADFPEKMHIAFATCGCGVREFIVDGSTQECQHCGGLMYRHVSKEYGRNDSGGV